ncbi:MAG: carbohydrate-binding domain-containing protein [Proteobacteria bacterium]|nr:carbohydrate-binding domain-containing protein [Pseudomonadota bacterium]MCL2307948.1 carbohydrate-binding domain-containing protein [Pseudomonadota bacterium]
MSLLLATAHSAVRHFSLSLFSLKRFFLRSCLALFGALLSVLALSAFSLPALAAGTPSAPVLINLSTVNSNGPGYTYAVGGTASGVTVYVVTITENGYYTLTGTVTTKRVVVQSGLTNVNITLNNLDITRTLGYVTGNYCAFSMAGATVNLTLVGTNTLRSGQTCAGLRAPGGSILIIGGAGTLNAYGGTNSAGIGAGYDGSTGAGGVITINSGTINANGEGGTGIGGSSYYSGGNITINGGTVTANGGVYNAGIGGRQTVNDAITINDGNITAIGAAIGTPANRAGAGLGGGQSYPGGSTTINGGIVTATGGVLGGAGIGGGSAGSSSSAASGGFIVITGGEITASGGRSSAGIGGGGGYNGSDSGAITITGDADVDAQGGNSNDASGNATGSGGAGIGSGGTWNPENYGGVAGSVNSIIIDTSGTVSATGGSGVMGSSGNHRDGANIGYGGGLTDRGTEVTPGTGADITHHKAAIIQRIGGTVAPLPAGINIEMIPHGANQSFVITPDVGYAIRAVLADNVNVGGIVTHWTLPNIVNDARTIEALFTKLIDTAAITVTAPVIGATPNTTAGGGGAEFSIGAATWSPAHTTFQPGTSYTVTVTLSANLPEYSFDWTLTAATINGVSATVTNNTGASVKLSYQFPPTSTIRGITIHTQPAQLIYTDGDLLDLSGLIVTLTHERTSPENIPLEQLGAHNIRTEPANGSALNMAHNGFPVNVIYNNDPAIRTATNALTVNPKAATTPASIPVLNPAALVLLALMLGGMALRQRKDV